MNAVKEDVRFLVVHNLGPVNRIYPSPKKGEVPDLVLPSFGKEVVDPIWSSNHLIIRDIEDGIISMSLENSPPRNPGRDIDPEYKGFLKPNERAFVLQICQLPLTEQVLEGIRLSRHISEKKISRKGSRVTVNYLKDRHINILKAALDLEQRFQKRPDVIELLESEVEKIENL